jgi:hypothetical protein
VDGDEPKAIAKVRQKYMDEFLKKDLHLFLGTTQQRHQVAPNPWVIIGVLPIPAERQLQLSLNEHADRARRSRWTSCPAASPRLH